MILFVTEQVGVPSGTLSVHCHGNPNGLRLQDQFCQGILDAMKKQKPSALPGEYRGTRHHGPSHEKRV